MECSRTIITADQLAVIAANSALVSVAVSESFLRSARSTEVVATLHFLGVRLPGTEEGKLLAREMILLASLHSDFLEDQLTVVFPPIDIHDVVIAQLHGDRTPWPRHSLRHIQHLPQLGVQHALVKESQSEQCLVVLGD